MSTDLEIDLSDFKEERFKIKENVFIYEFKNGKLEYAGKIFYINIDEDKESFNEKMSRLINTNYPSILKVFGYSIRENYPMVITEFMRRKSLADLFYGQLHKQKYKNWNDTKKYITAIGVAYGIKSLHSIDIVHKNLRPSKILFDMDYYPHISLLDILIDPEDKKSNDLIYFAPELLDEPDNFSKSSDIYAFSMIVFQLLKGQPPFKNSKKIKNDIRLQNYPSIDSFSGEMQEIFQSCWYSDPENRLAIDDVIKHLLTDEAKNDFGDIDENEIANYISNFN